MLMSQLLYPLTLVSSHQLSFQLIEKEFLVSQRMSNLWQLKLVKANYNHKNSREAPLPFRTWECLEFHSFVQSSIHHNLAF